MRLATACAALLLALPTAAQASTVSVADGALTLEAESSFLDADVEQDGGDFNVYDYGESLSPGAGCKEAPPDPLGVVTGGSVTEYTCSGDISRVKVIGGAEHDFVYAFIQTPAEMIGNAGEDGLATAGGDAHLDGGEGDDFLQSNKGADELIGGPGDDRLVSDPSSGGCEECDEPPPPPTGSNDKLDGGPGRDILVPGIGSDTISGGDGRDTLDLDYGAPVTIALDRASGIEAVSTGRLDDVVTGDDRFNELRTQDGNDTVDGRGGSDSIDTGKGDDTVLARDGVPDDITCGEGADRVTADPDDFVDSDCETVERAAFVAPAPAAPPPPVLQLTARRKGARLVVSGRVVPGAGTPAGGCAGGGVTVSVAGLGKRVRRLGTVLKPDCTFSVRLRAKRKAIRRVRVSASFAGTPTLPAASAAPVAAKR